MKTIENKWMDEIVSPKTGKVKMKKSYHISYNAELVCYGLSSQLNLTYHTSQESSDFKYPPGQANHEHTGNSQLDEETPLLQTVKRPTCSRSLRKKTKQTPLKDGQLFKHSLEDHAVVKKTDLPMWLCVDPSSRCKHIGTKPANTVTWHWLLQIHFSSTMSRRSDQK